MIADLRFALRQLAKSPGFAVTAILTLALGIGACTAIFSVVNSVLLRPLPYPEAEKLMVIRETCLPKFPEFSVAPGNYFDWRAQATSFEELASMRRSTLNLTGRGEPIRLLADIVTPNYFGTLGVRPVLGRGFTDAEVAAEPAKVVVLSHGCWVRQFGERPEVLNETIQLDGAAFTIIGVLPRTFQPGSRTDLFLPIAHTADKENHGGHYIRVVGRLKPGVTADQARTELTLIAERLEKQYPDTNTGWRIKLTPMLEAAVGDVRPTLYALSGAVGFLLLIACANVANLLLARATARTKEIAVRTALGASRRRLLRQLLTESLLLAAGGAAFGVALAWWGTHALIALAPDLLPRAREVSLDGTALGFTTALVLLTGVAFGLVPAWQATRVNLNDTLKDSGRGTSEGAHRQRLRGALVVAEVAIALMLLAGAGLLIRSFGQLQEISPGFQPADAFTVNLSLPDQKYGDDPQRAAFVERALAQLAPLPGVQTVGVSHVVPFTGSDYVLGFSIGGRPPDAPGKSPSTNYYAVTPDYFRAMGIPLLRGRFFTDRDRAGAPRVALINETMARRYFPDQDPIGQRINVTNGPETWREIVGVVGDTKHYRLDGDTTLQTYEPFAQQPFDFMTFVVRTHGPVADLPAALRAAIYTVDRDQPVASVRPLRELLAGSIARQRFSMLLFAVFSGVALVLAAIGIYGVMAYSVAQRTGEIGIRMALGAQRRDVLRLVFTQGGRLVLLGLAAGLGGALLLTRLLSSMLFGVSPHDPLTFAIIALVLTAVAALACFVPARRATKVDPLVALRND